ncbi:MAG: zinc finger CCCH domain-containing protein [Gammaproteobacteria bacterium]|nr:zinc finger CCCH domain-containing protein [Gammaproteobacteria bacterium]
MKKPTKVADEPPVFDTDEKTSTKRKFQEMKPVPDGEELRRTWRLWKRDFEEWSNQQFDDRTKVQSLMSALPSDMKVIVYSRIPTTIETVDEVYIVLESEFGSDETIQRMVDIQAYQAHKRGKESLRVWLSMEMTLRTRYELATGNSDELNGHAFLLKAGLTLDEQKRILSIWSLEQRRTGASGHSQPTVSEMERELREMLTLEDMNQKSSSGGDTILLTSEADKGKKKKRFRPKGVTSLKKKLDKVTALVTAMSDNTTKNRDNGVRKPDWLCGGCGKRVFGDRTSCFFCAKERTATDRETNEPRKLTGDKGKGKGGKGKGDPAASTKRECHFFAKGTCRSGDKCKFLHTAKVEK